MKRFWMFLMVSVLTLSLIVPFAINTGASAASGTTGDCTWTLDDNGVLTISGNGAMADYDDCGPWGTSITEVIIEDGVTEIGVYAFYECASLISVTIPSSVTTIGADAFRYCARLTSVTIPNSVTDIGDRAFSSCSSLTSITIPGNARIGTSAFSSCFGLTSVTISDGVTSIGAAAFYNCSQLTSVTIPDSVTTIDASAFRWCTGLTSVIIGNGVTTIGSCAFFNCGLISVTIPDSVTAIGSIAFSSCSSLTSVTIGNGVTTIGDDAFLYCDSLTSVTIPHTVTSIGADAFDQDDTLGVHEDSVGHTYAVTNSYPYTLTEHTCDEITTVPSTCTVAGSESGICNVCGKNVIIELPLAEHSFEDGVCVACGKLEYGIENAYLLLKHIDGHDVGFTDGQADVNGDGKVTIFDAVRMLQNIAAQ